MARVALIRLFGGLNIGLTQVAGMLQAHGHECIIIYMAHYFMQPMDKIGPNHRVSRLAAMIVGPRARLECWQTYEPFSETEKDLLIGLLKDCRADLVGFSLTSSSIVEAVELTRLIKDKLSIPVIWGGPGPTVEAEESVRDAGLLCVGEGERALLDVAEAIDNGAQSFANIPDIWGVENGTVFRNPPRPLVTDLDELPFPRLEPEHHHFIDENKLVSNTFPPYLHKFYPIRATRGCPYACTFCVNPVYQRMFDGYTRVRTRSVSHVMDELLFATRQYDVRRVHFYDDIFGMNKKWVDEFAARYKREIGLPIWGFADPRFIKRELLSTLKDAGLDSVELGIQSGSQRILKDVYNRNTPREKILRSANIIVDLGLDCLFDLLSFVKGETEEDCRETFDLLVDLPKELCFSGVAKLVYYPHYNVTIAQEGGEEGSMTPELYEYYHRLYHLTRTRIPRPIVRFIGSLGLFRRHPRMLNPFLPKHYRVPKYIGDIL